MNTKVIRAQIVSQMYIHTRIHTHKYLYINTYKCTYKNKIR